jgi:signal transduction histidine kinase
VSSSAPDRSRAGLAWLLFTVAIGTATAGVAFSLMSGGSSEPSVTSIGVGDVLFLVAFQLFSVVGVLIASRRPENAVGWLLLVTGVANGIGLLSASYPAWALYVHPSAPFGAEIAGLTSWLWIPMVALPATFLLLVFPDGHLPSPRWRWFARVLAVGMIAGSIGILFSPGTVDGFPGVQNPFAVSWLEWLTIGIFLIPVGVVAAVASLVIRFRRATGDDRQQIKWIAVAAAIVGVLYGTALVVSFSSGWDSQVTPGWIQTLQGVCVASFGLLPIAIGIAVLKYRLYDLDLVIRKTVVFALLAAFITAVYVGIVVGIGTIAGAASNTVLSAVAAAAVALAFQPVRRGAQRIADRLVYGSRATPYELLSDFSQRVSSTYAADDVLPRMARLVAEGIGADRAAVWLRSDGVLRVAASWPDDDERPPPVAIDDGDAVPPLPGSTDTFPVDHHGDSLGALGVAIPLNDPMDPTKAKLVEDLASQAGLVLHNVRLTAELQARLDDLRAAQKRLVAAQDHERRKLERNIHDGAQQQLVALTVKLRLAQALVGKEPARAESMLVDLQADSQSALEDLRDLARGIYPPLLADKGLPAALGSQLRKSAVPATLLADGVGRYPQEIEAAVYFSCLEALQNAAKYAAASSATVELHDDGAELGFTVSDDGLGFDPSSVVYGTGLQGITDRLGAIDGRLAVESVPGRGTVVTGHVPARGRTDADASAGVMA